jgi:hypothetical protein
VELVQDLRFNFLILLLLMRIRVRKPVQIYIPEERAHIDPEHPVVHRNEEQIHEVDRRPELPRIPEQVPELLFDLGHRLRYAKRIAEPKEKQQRRLQNCRPDCHMNE